MWYDVENGDSIRPSQIDTTSSHVYVFVREHITLVPEAMDEAGVLTPAHYRWKEMKIPREIWGLCEKVMDHGIALDDVYNALTELAEMITEGEQYGQDLLSQV